MGITVNGEAWCGIRKKSAPLRRVIQTRKEKIMFKTQKEAAAMLGVSVKTLKAWKGVPRVEISRNKHGRPLYRYDVQKVRAWLESRTAEQEVEA